MKIIPLMTLIMVITVISSCNRNKTNRFPDNSIIPSWFSDSKDDAEPELHKKYVITDFGVVKDSTIIQTERIQKVIDKVAGNGGGVIVIPQGTFLSGALFFSKGTHLYLSEGAVLKGSDQIEDYPLLPSRIEGQCLDYYAALINVSGADGFSVSGKGTIDGNGLKFWESFWKRREENPQCTNLEVHRPRLIFINNSNDISLRDVRLKNSGFWTCHFYKCKRIRIIDLDISSPVWPVRAPSTDGIDIDACSEVLIKGCHISVNDDAIALKGGKGPWADRDTCNGENTDIIIENCSFGFCHSALTLGSESVHDKNILMRNCTLNGALKLLWLKMRPDTPQKYEYITVDNISGNAASLLYIKPWTQFFDLKGRKDPPHSISEKVTLKNISLRCDVLSDTESGNNYTLSDFTFENLTVTAKNGVIDKNIFNGLRLRNVMVNDKAIK